MRALAGPITGEPSVGIGTGSSSSLDAGRAPNFDAFASAMAAASVFPALIAPTVTEARPRLKEQFGSFTRHSATFMPHPQEQACVRSAFSARVFLAGVSPLKSTPARSVTVCHSCANRSAAPPRTIPTIHLDAGEAIPLLYWDASPPAAALHRAAPGKQRHQPDDQEHEEQHLGDSHGCPRQPAETQHRGDQGENQEYQRPMQHLQPPGATFAPLR